MDLETQRRVAIAEARGWKRYEKHAPDLPPSLTAYIYKDGTTVVTDRLPNYFNDLNATRELVDFLRQDPVRWMNYCNTLYRVINGDGHDGHWTTDLMTATAAQQAEAFLKVMGLWAE